MTQWMSCYRGVRVATVTVALACYSWAGGAFGQQQQQQTAPSQAIAGYWTTDARFDAKMPSRAPQSDYFWVGRMWGRIDATGKLRFDADNGCVATGLLAPIVPGGSNWSGTANIAGCAVPGLNGRYSINAGGGSPHLSLRFYASNLVTVNSRFLTDTVEVAGTFARYRP